MSLWFQPLRHRLKAAVRVGFGCAVAAAIAAATIVSGAAVATARAAEGGEAAAVSGRFDGLRTALEKGDGRQVMAGLSAESAARLEAMRRAARSPAGGRDSAALGPSERLISESMRRALTPADLSRRSLDEVVTRALSHGSGAMGGRPGGLAKELVKGSLGPVSVKGDRASAPLLIEGKPSLFQADFIRDSGGWKVDILPSLRRGDLVLTTMAAMKGSTPEAIIESILAGGASRLRRPG